MAASQINSVDVNQLAVALQSYLNGGKQAIAHVPVSDTGTPIDFNTYLTAMNNYLASIDGGIPVALGQATMAASMPVVIASNQSMLDVEGNVASAATDSGNPVKVGAVYRATPATLTDGQRGDLTVDSRHSLRVALQLSNNTNPISGLGSGADGTSNTQAGLVSYAFGMRYNGSSWDRDRKPNATARIVSAAASTNPTAVKASAGDLATIHGYNAAASVRYIKLYNKASSPTVGTDTPVMTLAVGPTQAFRFDFQSHYFSTGIALALTTGSADADTGALTAGDILGLTVSYA